MNEEQKQLIDKIIDDKHELQKDFDLLLLLFEQHTDFNKTQILNELEEIKNKR